MKKKSKVIIGLVIALVTLFLLLTGITVLIMRMNFGRGDYPEDRSSRNTAFGWYPAFAANHPRQEVEFPSGELNLKGWIYGAENTDRLLVFAHGISSGHEAYVNQLLWFADHGWCVFAYDAAGSGDSPGDSTKGLVQSAIDLDSALTYVEQDPALGKMPVYLLGHSWGGYAVGAVLNFDHNIRAAVSLSGYADPKEMLRRGTELAVGKAGAYAFYPFALIYHKLTFGSLSGLNAVDGINKANIPFLAMHGESDAFVGYDLGIISQKDRITNPQAEYLPITGEYSHHNDYFHSEECNREVAARITDNSLTQEQKLGLFSENYASDADKALFRAVNEPLLESIEAFYDKNS